MEQVEKISEYLKKNITLTVYDGNILLDTDDVAADLKVKVRDYVQKHLLV